jgi:hypothetical protein
MHQALTGFESINDPWEQLSFQLSGPHSVVVFPVRAFFSGGLFALNTWKRQPLEQRPDVV